jgi:predicted DNA-binding transcriptional regulator AlpA
MAEKADALPMSLPPRGLDRVQTAEYVGVSPSKFDGMVADGRMPQPKEVDRRLVWDRLEVDAAFSKLPRRNGHHGDSDDGENGGGDPIMEAINAVDTPKVR